MASVSTYLNFARETRPAFEFYKRVFGGEFGPISTFRDVAQMEGGPSIPEEDLDLITNIQLTITAGHVLMGTDAPASLRAGLNQGNNVVICLDPETRAEAERIYADLSDGGLLEMPLSDYPGGYFGTLTDKFGICWMIYHSDKA